MTEEKLMTGYPSIDKPWLKYYKEPYKEINLHNTIYQNFVFLVNENENKEALFLDDRYISRKELLDLSDMAAESFSFFSKGRTLKVGFLSVNRYEESFLFLGLYFLFIPFIGAEITLNSVLYSAAISPSPK